eukprot:8189187-Pyramimonas_sp.AAC.1
MGSFYTASGLGEMRCYQYECVQLADSYSSICQRPTAASHPGTTSWNANVVFVISMRAGFQVHHLKFWGSPQKEHVGPWKLKLWPTPKSSRAAVRARWSERIQRHRFHPRVRRALEPHLH